MENTLVKWATLENSDTSNSLKQHGFVADGNSNISLCGKIIHYDGNCMHASMDFIEDEGISDNPCQLCKRSLK